MWNGVVIRAGKGVFHRCISQDSLRKVCSSLSSLGKEYYVISIIDAYISLGMVNRAVSLFNKYRRYGHQFDVGVYNHIIATFAEKGSITSAVMLYDTLSRDEMSPNFQTYAIMLEMHSRSEDWKSVNKIIKQMNIKGYQLQHIFHQTALSKAQASQIHKVLKHFGLSCKSPPLKGVTYPKLAESFYMTDNPKDSQLRSSDTAHVFTSRNTAMNCMKRQLQIEFRGYECVRSISSLDEKKNKSSNDTVSKLYEKWKSDLTSIVNKDIEEFMSMQELLSHKDVKPPKQFPFLALLSAEKWANILVYEVLYDLVKQPDGLPMQHICYIVGRSARTQFLLSEASKNGRIEKVKNIYEKYLDEMLEPCSRGKLPREVWNELEDAYITMGSMDFQLPNWNSNVYFHTVSALLERFLEVATISSLNSQKPAFEHIIKIEDGTQFRRHGYIRPTKYLYKFMKKAYIKEKEEYFYFNTTLLPMLIPPKPWTSPESGGYLLTPATIIRSKEEAYQHQLMLQRADNLHAVYDSLNYLSSSSWRVNKRILSLVIEIFNRGGDEKLGIPGYPATKGVRDKKLEVDIKAENEQYSLWMDMLYRLSLCNHYKDDIVWLPHNMDFRGRAYPISPHVSHLTMDVGRSLMMFASGYPLGAGGLDWLKIHLVNLHGLKKKESLQARLEYANHQIHEIINSADMPLTGNRWWTSGDDPWQVLACCMEITDAIRSDHPSSFISHLPVHQDGSCNGLQHYSALGRDLLGGQKVNLLPSEKPEDTYAEVAEMVEKRRKQDAESGNEIAKLLDGKINRKVVKQTVMTIVYGVTRIGGRLQVEKQLRTCIEKDHLWECSNYVTRQIFEVLYEMFHHARSIQDWLASSGRKISLAGKPVEWLTPLGLPVVQPYHKPLIYNISTAFQSLEVKTTTETKLLPNVRKQKMGMPPNYVHSLDSTHMMLTSLYCGRAGVPFVSVHDSYWTHACFVEEMSKICRQQFINLHKQPILNDLAAYWTMKYGGLKYKDVKKKGIQECVFEDDLPSGGELDLDQVLNSEYFFN